MMDIEAAKPAAIEVKGSFPKPDFSKFIGKRILAFGLSLDSSIDVCVQLGGTVTNEVLDLVDKYIETLKPEYRPSPKSFAPGSPCLAFYENDGGWYRARIIKQINGTSKFRVVLVDYGNFEVVTAHNLMDIPSYLINYVEGSSACSLTDFDGDDTEDELDFLKAAITEKDLICQIEDTAYHFRGRESVLLTVFAEVKGRLLPLKEVMKAKFPKIIKPNMIHRAIPLPPPPQLAQDVCDGPGSSYAQPSEAYTAAPRTACNTSRDKADQKKELDDKMGTLQAEKLAKLEYEYKVEMVEKEKDAEIKSLKERINHLERKMEEVLLVKQSPVSSPSLDNRSQNALTNIDNRNNIKTNASTTNNISTTTSDLDWTKTKAKCDNIIGNLEGAQASNRIDEMNDIISRLLDLIKSLADTFHKEVQAVRSQLSNKEAEVNMLRGHR